MRTKKEIFLSSFYIIYSFTDWKINRIQKNICHRFMCDQIIITVYLYESIRYIEWFFVFVLAACTGQNNCTYFMYVPAGLLANQSVYGHNIQSISVFKYYLKLLFSLFFIIIIRNEKNWIVSKSIYSHVFIFLWMDALRTYEDQFYFLKLLIY